MKRARLAMKILFARAGGIEAGAIIEEDVRKNYGEHRYRALGWIDDRLHAVVFTPRAGKVPVMSLRKRTNER